MPFNFPDIFMLAGRQIHILIKSAAQCLKTQINFATFPSCLTLSGHKLSPAFHRGGAALCSGSGSRKHPSPARSTTSPVFTDGCYTCGFCICSPLPLKSPAVPGLSFDVRSVGAAIPA